MEDQLTKVILSTYHFLVPDVKVGGKRISVFPEVDDIQKCPETQSSFELGCEILLEFLHR